MKYRVKRTHAMGDCLLAMPFVQYLNKKHYVEFESIHLKELEGVCFEKHVKPGWDKDSDTILIDLDLAYERTPEVHIQDAYKKVFRSHRVFTPDLAELKADIGSGQVLNIRDGMPEDSKVCVMHIGGYETWKGKQPSMQFFTKVVEKLRWRGYKTITIGGRNDFSVPGEWMTVRNIPMNIIQTKNIIEQADLFIGIDSGPFHIASLTNTPQVGIFIVVKGELRVPKNKQVGIYEPKIDCVGCLAKLPAPTTTHKCLNKLPYECHKKLNADHFVDFLHPFGVPLYNL